MRTAAAAICLGIVLQLSGGVIFAQTLKTGEDCGSLDNAFGPFDYYDSRNADELKDVNGNHLHRVITGVQSTTNPTLAINNIDYMLRAFPNHPQVLRLMTEYFLKGGKSYEHRSPECYFDRAVRFAPNDGNVRMLLGVYLLRKGNAQDARVQLEKARELMPESADAAYNLGALDYREKRYQEAKDNAVKAYSLGYPLPALRDNLRKLGYWDAAADATVAAANAPKPAEGSTPQSDSSRPN
jgi:Flp pilus assembly protein TadD, contains TPR repeats